MRPGAAAAASCLAAALLVTAAAGAATLRVAPDGGGDHPTIQAALDAAAPGDVVLLAPGTYHGPGNRDLDVHGRAVTVRGSGDPDAPSVLDPTGPRDDGTPHRAFHLRGGAVGAGPVLADLVVRWGRADGDSLVAGAGGAVLCQDASPRFERCVFRDNLAVAGGAVAVRGGAPVFRDCTFVRNSAERGGALDAREAEVLLVGCRVDNNAGFSGGGVAATGGRLRLEGCRLTANLGYDGGAVLAVEGARAELSDCWLQANHANLGAGVCGRAATLALDHTVLMVNTAGAGGGLLASRGSTATLDHCLVAYSRQGGSVAHDSDSAVTARCCDFFGNEEGDWYGALAAQAVRDGNHSADPGCADPAGGDFSLPADAPARRPRGDCGPLVRGDAGAGAAGR